MNGNNTNNRKIKPNTKIRYQNQYLELEIKQMETEKKINAKEKKTNNNSHKILLNLVNSG